jgi:hypothetical protein
LVILSPGAYLVKIGSQLSAYFAAALNCGMLILPGYRKENRKIPEGYLKSVEGGTESHFNFTRTPQGYRKATKNVRLALGIKWRQP